MNFYPELRRSFWDASTAVRTGYSLSHVYCIHTHFCLAPLLSFLQESEPLFDSKSGSKMVLFPALFEDDDEIVRFEKGDQSFSVVFSHFPNPGNTLPLISLLEIAQKYTSESKECALLIQLFEHAKQMEMAELAVLRQYTERVLTLFQNTANENSDFGLHIFHFLLPDNTYFVDPKMCCTQYDADTFLQIHRTQNLIQTELQTESGLVISYQDAFRIHFLFYEHTFTQYDFPVRLFVEKQNAKTVSLRYADISKTAFPGTVLSHSSITLAKQGGRPHKTWQKSRR